MYILVHVVVYIWSGPGFILHIFITKAQISYAADQHLCFQYTNSTIPLLPESHFFSASRAKKEVCYIVIMSPPCKGWETYCFSPCVCMSVCLCVCVSVGLSVRHKIVSAL